MIQVYRDPQLFDFLAVCHELQADQIEQIEAFSGTKYNPDAIAAQYYLSAGPRWAAVKDDKVLAVAGFHSVAPGVWQDWMFSTEECWAPENWYPMTRIVRRALTAMLKVDAHRLQCVSLASRIHAHKWYSCLGLRLESTLQAYGANGENALMFVRLRDNGGQ